MKPELQDSTPRCYIQRAREHQVRIRAESNLTINLTPLTEDCVGAYVAYVPQHLRTYGGAISDPYSKDIKYGYITHWNYRYVLVCYTGKRWSLATCPEDLFIL